MAKHFKKQVGVVPQRTGVSFRVWAPFASSVAVIGSFSDWSERPLTSENDGYWSALIKDAAPGHEYKFVIKNGENTYRRNDPRAKYIVTTSGNSVIVGDTFDWGSDNFTPAPLDQQVIYELHVGTFNRSNPAIGGTFGEVTEKLDYLKDLGINMIELMPISTMFMDRGWGYATDYIYAVESLYGGRQQFMEFVKAAHDRGMGVVLDVVYNHFGPDERLDLWQFDGWQQDGKGGIYFYNDWRAETPWGNTRPDFGRHEVQQYILDNVQMWLHECHVDGLRVDSTIFIRNAKGYNNDPANDLPEGWQLLQDITTLAKKINPAVVTIGEDVADNEYITRPVTEGGAGFSAQWELNFPHSLRSALGSNDPSAINLTEICSELVRRYNDDPLQRVVYVDSHDSAANGSARLAEVIAPGEATGLFARQKSLLAATLLLTAPGIPMLFQGQEFMEGGAFNDWQALDWTKATQHHGIVEAYCQLISLRKNTQGLSRGLTGKHINLMHVDENNKVIAYHRWHDGGPADDVVVIINFTDQELPDYLLGFPRNGSWKVRFTSTYKGYGSDFSNAPVTEVQVDNGTGGLRLPPNAAIILSQDA